MRYLFALLLLFASVQVAVAATNNDLDALSALKQITRLKITRAAVPFANSSVITDNDDARNLVDDFRVSSIAEMQNAGLNTAALSVQPWSDSYWPTVDGSIATRYADPAYKNSDDWAKNYNYLFPRIGQAKMDKLSPAEKYDMLVGDRNFTLTRAALEMGREYYNYNGKVDTWIGICHGWAPASFMEPRPKKTIKAITSDGYYVEFRPSDLKALASLLWANGSMSVRYIGGRCTEAKPRIDSRGRALNPDCLDTNPGTWHMAVVNQLGISHRSLIMDTDLSAEVWNQPLLSYHYSLFNPQTMRQTDSLQEARIDVSRFSNDRYRDVRSSQTRYIVGVIMDLSYISETRPSLATTDGPQNDSIEKQRYTYDLELDANNNIIGGEWYDAKHPDFLWTPLPNYGVNTVGDDYLYRTGDTSYWSSVQSAPMPQIWQQAALESSQRTQPLAHIVESLLRAAQ